MNEEPVAPTAVEVEKLEVKAEPQQEQKEAQPDLEEEPIPTELSAKTKAMLRDIKVSPEDLNYPYLSLVMYLLTFPSAKSCLSNISVV